VCLVSCDVVETTVSPLRWTMRCRRLDLVVAPSRTMFTATDALTAPSRAARLLALLIASASRSFHTMRPYFPAPTAAHALASTRLDDSSNPESGTPSAMDHDPVSLATAATRADGPRLGLQAVSQLREALDELEIRHVDRALEAGWSWTQVGRALGVSKQAAHRRHASRATSDRADLETEPSPAGEQRVVVRVEAQRVVAAAREEAGRAGRDEVLPEDLLAGVTSDSSNAAAVALRKIGVDVEGVRLALAPDGGARAGSRPATRISQATRRVLERSLEESQRLCHGHIGVEHVLLALLHEEGGRAGALLERLGKTRDDLERTVCDVLKNADFQRSLT
jgi:hypothetical protein